MKKSLMWGVVISILFLVSCGEEPYEPNYEYGKIEAIVNGQKWIAEAMGYENQNDPNTISLKSYIFNTQGYKRESVSIRSIPLKNGTFQIYPFGSETGVTASYYKLAADGDALEATYRIDSNFLDNSISISSIDLGSKWVEGEFEAVFIDQIDAFYSDTLKFTNGSYRVQIID